MSNPTDVHEIAVRRILQYLKGTPGRGLYFKKNSNKGIVYTGSDWAGCASDRKSTTDYCTFVLGNLITWRSKKQSVVARSRAEAELRAMAHGRHLQRNLAEEDVGRNQDSHQLYNEDTL